MSGREDFPSDRQHGCRPTPSFVVGLSTKSQESLDEVGEPDNIFHCLLGEGTRLSATSTEEKYCLHQTL